MSRLSLKILWVILIAASPGFAQEKVLYLQPGALDYVGIYQLRGEDPNLTGADVNIAMISRSITYENGYPRNDFSVNTEHLCFYNSDINQFSYPDIEMSYSPHSTAVASILVGDNKASFYPQLGEFYYEGAAPGARLDVYEFWYFLQTYLYGGADVGADVISISSGSTFGDWWTRGFENLAESGTVVIAGIGNGSNAEDPVLYPGASANAIGVGVADCVVDSNLSVILSNFGLPRTEHSSFGPASEKRCKPDLIAPGNCIVADVNGSYTISGNYSSFATPVVSGTAGLLMQRIKQDFNDVTGGERSLLVKCLLLSSADKLAYWHKGYPEEDDDHVAALDYVQGAGMVNAYDAMDILIGHDKDKAGWITGEIADGEFFDVNLAVEEPNEQFITATVVFNYDYEDAYPYSLINEPNLRLELWGLDSNDPAGDVLLDYSDCSSGTVEHIYVKANVKFKDYILRVVNTDLAEDYNHAVPFAVSWQVDFEKYYDDILYYDLSNDGVVDNNDFIGLIDNVGKAAHSKKGYRIGDLDFNGQIEMNDLKLLMLKKGQIADWKQ